MVHSNEKLQFDFEKHRRWQFRMNAVECFVGARQWCHTFSVLYVWHVMACCRQALQKGFATAFQLACSLQQSCMKLYRKATGQALAFCCNTKTKRDNKEID
jgi:N-formylglutamate amidohydrolase